ncbi:hypothetical protein [Paenibacillus sp. Mc5Re-14]|uniref:hypothetical protein n=1 Tax=Paenibacillus sp. Mc5Re-14 TaxID=1030529 RepID=UPI000AD52326|nr:hypothetical protein [Paenibacillus sp. Mc5Re-14]
MGYCTSYELSIVGGHYDLLESIIDSDKEMFYGLEPDGSTYDSVKWYDHEQDMKYISKLYSNHIFKLCGEGEDNSDIWVKYFKDGKMQVCRAKITFDEYDEKKLV